jgi:NAD(P)H-dependent flavin oxidoreductase YrpB (nitropropane dioxygenase family)
MYYCDCRHKINVFGFVLITMCFWVGTQFVTSEEAGATRANKAALLSADNDEVVRTVIYFGRPLRVRWAPYVDDDAGAPVENENNGCDGNRESRLLAQGHRVACNNITIRAIVVMTV